MKAIIPAAGMGTRLFPITKFIPKPLVPVVGKPLLNYIMEKIEILSEIDEIILLTNVHQNSHFMNWSKCFRWGKPLRLFPMSGAGLVNELLFFAKQDNLIEDFMIILGDTLFDWNLDSIVNFFAEKKESVISLYEMDDLDKITRKYGVVVMDEDRKIITYTEKPEHPQSHYIDAGCYIFTEGTIEFAHDYLKTINENEKTIKSIGHFIQWLVAKKRLLGYVHKGTWFDIGTIDSLNDAVQTYEQRLSFFFG
ncbi:MAG: nucleotidyltransferase family protein [bacterium]